MEQIKAKIEKFFNKILLKNIDQIMSAAQQILFAIVIVLQLFSFDYSNISNWGETEGLRASLIVWVGIAWIHWRNSDDRRRQMKKDTEMFLIVNQRAHVHEQKYQAVLNILDSIDKETLSKYGITIEEENEKNTKKGI